MNGFKKLVLASAVLAATSGAYAMEAMDDESMSSTTGQDGLTISLDSSIANLVVTYVDRDGYGGGFADAGAVVIGNTVNGIDVNVNDLVITIDAGGSAGTAAGSGMLNIGITQTSLNIGLGNVSIGVADAQNAGGSTVGAVNGIISFDNNAALNLSNTSMNIQLGNEDQGHMVVMSGSLGDITLTGLNILDASSGGSGAIGIGTLLLQNVNSNVAIDVTGGATGGLVIDTTGTTLDQIGLLDVSVGDLSSAADIGDIYLSNITVNSVITIRGH
jgi:hypothetical protein